MQRNVVAAGTRGRLRISSPVQHGHRIRVHRLENAAAFHSLRQQLEQSRDFLEDPVYDYTDNPQDEGRTHQLPLVTLKVSMPSACRAAVSRWWR